MTKPRRSWDDVPDAERPAPSPGPSPMGTCVPKRAVAARGTARTLVVRAVLAVLIVGLAVWGGWNTLGGLTPTTAAAAPLPTATVSTTLAPTAAGPTAVSVSASASSSAVTPQVVTADTMAAGTILIPSAGIYVAYAPEPGGQGDAVIPETTAGMWDHGAVPSDQAGTVLMWGHVDTAFAGLASTLPNGVVYIKDKAGRLTSWQVTNIYTEDRSSTHPNLYTRTGPHRLAIVTCGGPVRDGHYTDNIVVIAQETPR